MKVYEVTARIVSSIDSTSVWQGCVDDIVANNSKDAIELAKQQIVETIEYDTRIYPSIQILNVKSNVLEPAAIAKKIITAAEAHGVDAEPDHAFGDLQEALRLCLENMTHRQTAKFLKQYKASIQE